MVFTVRNQRCRSQWSSKHVLFCFAPAVILFHSRIWSVNFLLLLLFLVRRHQTENWHCNDHNLTELKQSSSRFSLIIYSEPSFVGSKYIINDFSSWLMIEFMFVPVSHFKVLNHSFRLRVSNERQTVMFRCLKMYRCNWKMSEIYHTGHNIELTLKWHYWLASKTIRTMCVCVCGCVFSMRKGWWKWRKRNKPTTATARNEYILLEDEVNKNIEIQNLDNNCDFFLCPFLARCQ